MLCSPVCFRILSTSLTSVSIFFVYCYSRYLSRWSCPSLAAWIGFLFKQHNRLCSVVDPEWFFSGSGSYFSVGRILHEFFSNILNINFTFVFPSWKCLRLHIMKRYKLFMENFFWYNKDFIFLNWAFLMRNCQILSVFSLFQKGYTWNLIRIRSYSDPGLEINFPDPDPAKSFIPDRIRIHNTRALLFFWWGEGILVF